MKPNSASKMTLPLPLLWRLMGIGLLAFLFALGGLSSDARADGGGWPTSTPTVTLTALPVPIATTVVTATALNAPPAPTQALVYPAPGIQADQGNPIVADPTEARQVETTTTRVESSGGASTRTLLIYALVFAAAVVLIAFFFRRRNKAS
jgi:hypothetical protein